MENKSENKTLLNSKEKMKKMRLSGINLFPNNFEIDHSINDIFSYINKKDFSSNEKEDVNFKTAGRIMSMNKFGKSIFIKIKDRTGVIQAYIRNEIIGDKKYNFFKKLDIGDFVNIEGNIFKTKTKEWTILAKDFKLLSKSLRSLPEKFHGLKDPEKRYRQRYLDLLINKKTKDIFIKRSKIIQEIRSFFINKDFIEVETPMMQSIPGGAEALPFKTHHNTLNIDLFLRIAPELYLKRLVIGGLERVFEINKNFRNEGISSKHNPEFTTIEFYQAYSTYKDLIKLTKELFLKLTLSVNGSHVIKYQENEIDFKNNWNTLDLTESLKTIGGIEENIIKDKEKIIKFASSKNIILNNNSTKGKLITKLFEILVEPKLIQPTFITGYPVEVSPLAKKNEINNNLTDRFELFIAGREIANGFSELNDPEEQNERFIQQVKRRNLGNKEAHHMDNEYIKAMEYGMPPTAGQGIGIDRLVMLLTNSSSIREVILFPQTK